MKVEISIGEVIDKLSILEIKYNKIMNETMRFEIQKEITELQECQKYKKKYVFFYRLLVYINTKIWELTDNIKQINIYDPTFSKTADYIFKYNQKRFRIKNWFNLLTSSEIKEQKSYELTKCIIQIDKKETIYDKIAEINYLLLEYDLIIFNTPFVETIKDIFIVPTYLFTGNEPYITDINIECFSFSNIEEDNKIFEFIPIKYVSGGAFGDFIHQLSVINEFFYKTGQKGILYISEGFDGDKFKNGVEYTYHDTYSIISKQKYIYEYKIHTDQSYDINLNVWRQSTSLYKKNWYHIFKETYNIEWGANPWLSTETDDTYKDYILINTTNYRWADNIDFYKLYNMYPERVIYISADVMQYTHFIQMTNLYNIPYLKVNSFEHLCTLISSCCLFVGSLSAPLAVAHSFNKQRICNINNGIDSIMVKNLNQIWDTITFIV